VKLFRGIRLKSLETSRIKKYLLYALGEIILVVIGITLAVAINNWNVAQSEEKQQTIYLENLVADIEKEIEQLRLNQIDVSKKLADIKMIKPFLGNDKTRRDSIVGKFFNLARIINFYPENTTYQTLINSGDMRLISDFELRKSLETHYSNHSKTLQAYERIEKIHEKYLGDYFIYSLDFKAIYQGQHGFLDDPLVQNIITSIEGAYFLLEGSNKKCLESNQQLLEKVNAVIKR